MAKTAERIFTPDGIAEHRQLGADHGDDVTRGAVAAGEEEEVDVALEELARGGPGVLGRRGARGVDGREA